jgi:hypothetical protein
MSTNERVKRLRIGCYYASGRLYLVGACLILASITGVLNLGLRGDARGLAVLVCAAFVSGVLEVFGATTINLYESTRLLKVRPLGILGRCIHLSASAVACASIVEEARPRIRIYLKDDEPLELGPWGQLSTRRHRIRVAKVVELMNSFLRNN